MSTFFSWVLMVGNALLCVGNIASGDYGWATAQAGIAGVLAYQLAVY